jgi:hypothetical protein
VRRAGIALAVALLCAQPAASRPTYFEVLTSTFGFGVGDPLYACGVCHYNWDGTGARNPFGTSVEQELYLGKPIGQALAAAVSGDPDDDGFTSLEELETHATLPGYSCTNYFDAVGAPANWHTFVTPFVASCLEPKDVRLAPSSAGFLTEVGEVAGTTITVFNNGSELPLEIESYGLLPGAPVGLSVDGPPPPFSLAVDESVDLTLSFAPEGVAIGNATLRIASDDPDEPVLDVPVSVFASVQPLGPPEARAACLRDIERAARRYGKTHLAEWTRCQGDEAAGKACDVGRRNVALLKAEAKLRDALSGGRGRRCASANLSPSLIGQPEVCGGGCGAIELDDFDDLTDCLVCRQGEARDALLGAALGTAPPDLPARAGSRDAERCQARLLADARKTAAKAQTLLGRCELANVTAAERADCAALHAEALDALAAKLAGHFARCRDAEGLEGCFAEGGDASCVGDTAAAGAAALVDAVFGED